MTNSKGSQQNISSSNKISEDPTKFRYGDYNPIIEKSHFEKKGSQIGNNNNKKQMHFNVGKI